MAILELSGGYIVIVDDDKVEELSELKWYINGSGYANTIEYGRLNGKAKLKSRSMHRLLTNCPDGLVVDHINGNKLDNRLENLEIVTQTENMRRVRGKPRKPRKSDN